MLAERLGHDRIDGQAGRGEPPVDFFDGLRFSRGPVFYKVEPPLKGNRIQHLPQTFIGGGGHESDLQAPVAADVPVAIDEVTSPDFFDNIGGLHRCADLGEKFVVGDWILTRDEMWRAKQARHRRG
jgi:hypothetical protein